MLDCKQPNIASGATPIQNAGRVPDENILQSNNTSPVQSVDSVRFVDSRCFALKEIVGCSYRAVKLT